MKTSSLQSKRRGHHYDSIRETNGQVYPLPEILVKSKVLLRSWIVLATVMKIKILQDLAKIVGGIHNLAIEYLLNILLLNLATESSWIQLLEICGCGKSKLRVIHVNHKGRTILLLPLPPVGHMTKSPTFHREISLPGSCLRPSPVLFPDWAIHIFLVTL